MDILNVCIIRVHEVKEYRHVVVATLDTDCWGCKEYNVPVVFDKHVWNGVKAQKQYLETEGHSIDSLKYFESLSDEEYFRRFERTLKDFTDEELVEEINRRASGYRAKIRFKVTAEVRDK